jgi:hypothetical protein
MPVNPEVLDYREYIGDGLYVGTHHGAICLYTFDGIVVYNEVWLDERMWKTLLMWKERVNERTK